jgi:Arc/MetJ-type ribon-helix-helix transcriptional regulator
MQQVIVELDEATVRRLNKVAPPRQRKRSEFIREAIRRALNERLEREMERAYRAQPQDPAEVDLDPDTWERPAPARRRKRR